MVTIKFKHLRNNQDFLTEIMSVQLPPRQAMKLGKAAKQLVDLFNEFENFRIELVKKYGEQNGDEFIVKEENKADFTKEFNEALDSEVELDIEPIKIEYLEESNIKISPLQYNFLSEYGFIE